MQVSQTIRVLEAKKLLCRTRSKIDTRAKQVGITRKGLVTLVKAMPIAIEVQRRLFGEPGLPGGALLKSLLLVHSQMPEEAKTPA